MFPEMREDLLRFGDIMYLDACKKQYNKLGWPYQGVIVMNDENQVTTVLKGLTIAESNDVYAFSIQTLQSLEPIFGPSSVKIIFGNQGITQDLLRELRIYDSCLLHGDLYPNIN